MRHLPPGPDQRACNRRHAVPSGGDDRGRRQLPGDDAWQWRALSPAWLERYDHFLAAERAGRPSTRWCARPGCHHLPAVRDRGALLRGCGARRRRERRGRGAPYLEPSLRRPRPPAVARGRGDGGGHARRARGAVARRAPAGAVAQVRVPAVRRRGGALRLQGGVARGMCEEVSRDRSCAGAASVAGQCPQCGLFIERRARCSHMDCRCGHSFCASACCRSSGGAAARSLVAGARPTRAPLSSSGWRPPSSSPPTPPRAALACAMAVGVGTTPTTSRAGSPRSRRPRAPRRYRRSSSAQAFLGAVQLLLARSCINATRLTLRVAVRQLDLAFGGRDARPARRAQVAGRHELLHPRDPARPAASLPRRILAWPSRSPSRRADACRVSRAPGAASARAAAPSVADRPPRAPHRPPGSRARALPRAPTLRLDLQRPRVHPHAPRAGPPRARGLAYACGVMRALAPRLIALVLYGASSLLLAPLGGGSPCAPSRPPSPRRPTCRASSRTPSACRRSPRTCAAARRCSSCWA